MANNQLHSDRSSAALQLLQNRASAWRRSSNLNVRFKQKRTFGSGLFSGASRLITAISSTMISGGNGRR